MTQEQARTTLCPMAATFGASQQLADGPGPHCVAASCMAWRWLPAPEIKSKLQAIKEYRDQHGTDLVTSKNAVEAAWTPPVPTQGFCGLAGAPQ